MSSVEDKLIQDIKKDLLKDKIMMSLVKYKKLIILVILVIILASIGYSSYNYYVKKQSEKYSVEFDEVKNSIIASKQDEALVLLDNIIKNGTNGYQFISYMQKVAIYLQEKKIQESIATLQEAKKEVNLQKYYIDMIQSIEYLIRSDNDKDKAALILDIEKNLDKKSSYYFINRELQASLLVGEKKYQEASDIYQEIISSDNVSQGLKDRSKRIRGMLFAYID